MRHHHGNAHSATLMWASLACILSWTWPCHVTVASSVNVTPVGYGNAQENNATSPSRFAFPRIAIGDMKLFSRSVGSKCATWAVLRRTYERD